jgi:hypothetical protein
MTTLLGRSTSCILAETRLAAMSGLTLIRCDLKSWRLNLRGDGGQDLVSDTLMNPIQWTTGRLERRRGTPARTSSAGASVYDTHQSGRNRKRSWSETIRRWIDLATDRHELFSQGIDRDLLGLGRTSKQPRKLELGCRNFGASRNRAPVFDRSIRSWPSTGLMALTHVINSVQRHW